MKGARRFLVTLLAALAATALRAQFLPLGPDFEVNTYSTRQQYGQRVASTGDGSFVVVWTSFAPGRERVD